MYNGRGKTRRKGGGAPGRGNSSFVTVYRLHRDALVKSRLLAMLVFLVGDK